MPKTTITNTFTAGTKIKSAEVNQNWIDNRTHFGSRAYLSADMDNLVTGAWTIVPYDLTSHNNGVAFDVANYRYVIPVDGYYFLFQQVRYETADLVVDKAYTCAIYNGIQAAAGVQLSVGVNHSSLANSLKVSCGPDIRYLTAGDHIYFYVIQASGVNTIDIDSGESVSYGVVEFRGI